MPLTADEIRAVRATAQYWSSRGWGKVGTGL
jgi:hypothetical protein